MQGGIFNAYGSKWTSGLAFFISKDSKQEIWFPGGKE